MTDRHAAIQDSREVIVSADTTRIIIDALNIVARHGLDSATREAIDQLSNAIRSTARNCDALGDKGLKCTLRAGHPGEVHEDYSYGHSTRFCVTSTNIKI